MVVYEFMKYNFKIQKFRFGFKIQQPENLLSDVIVSLYTGERSPKVPKASRVDVA